MKLFALLFVILQFNTSFSQEITLSEPCLESKNYKLISSNDEFLIFTKLYGTAPRIIQFFKKVNVKTGESEEFEFPSIKVEKLKGQAFRTMVKGDYVYQIFRFTNINGLKNRFALVKRNTVDFQVEGDIIFLYDHKGSIISPRLQFYQDDEGFYIISKTEGNSFIRHYDYDLELEWEKKSDFLTEPSIDITNISIDEANNMLIALKINEGVDDSKLFSFKTVPVKKSGLMFIYIQNDGEVTSISPEFNENLFVKAYDFKYLPKLNELIGVFYTSKLIDKKTNKTSGVGYSYLKWDLDGNLLLDSSNFFNYEDIDSDELKKHLQLSKLDKNLIVSEEGLKTVNIRPYFLFKEDGGVIVAYNDFYLQRGKQSGNFYWELANSKFVYEISSEGDLKWQKFFPYYKNNVYNNTFFKYSNEELHIYTTEFKENYNSDRKYELTSLAGVKTWDGLILSKRVIDCKTGELKSFEPVIEPIENFLLKDFKITPSDKEYLSFIVEFHNTRKNLKKYLIIDYGQK